MQIDLRTVAIEPQRQAFDHLVRRFARKLHLVSDEQHRDGALLGDAANDVEHFADKLGVER